MTFDSAGNKYVTGGFSGTQDFDLSNSLADNADVLTADGNGFAAKYAADNRLLWVRPIGGSEIAVDGTGNVYIVGGFQGSVASLATRR